MSATPSDVTRGKYCLVPEESSPPIIQIEEGFVEGKSNNTRYVAQLKILRESDNTEPPAGRVLEERKPYWLGTDSDGLDRRVFEDPLSNQCLAFARKWISDCARFHLKCSRRTSSPLLKLILDIENELVLVTAVGEVAPYVALSYFSSNKPSLLTTTAQYRQSCEGQSVLIPTNDISGFYYSSQKPWL